MPERSGAFILFAKFKIYGIVLKNNNLKYMARTLDKGIKTLTEAGIKALNEFEKKMNKLVFTKRPVEDILVELVELSKTKPIQIPDRANAENSIQDQYLYQSETGYQVIVHTGIIGKTFSDYGYAWPLVRDEKKERRWIRPSGHDTTVGVLSRLLKYAQFAKNIADGRPAGMDLVEFEENKFRWESPTGESKPFLNEYYVKGMTKDDAKYVLNALSRTEKHLVTSRKKKEEEDKPVVRRRHKRGTWFR